MNEFERRKLETRSGITWHYAAPGRSAFYSWGVNESEIEVILTQINPPRVHHGTAPDTDEAQAICESWVTAGKVHPSFRAKEAPTPGAATPPGR